MVNMDNIVELRVLSRLLAHPEGDALEGLKEVVPHYPWLAEAVAELEGITMEQWQGEHTRIFINGFPRTLAPPFMSAWSEGQMAGHGVRALRQVYQATGLEPAEGMPGDYLGTMLEFLAYLLENPKDGGAMGADAFKEQFFHPWIRSFTQALQGGSELKLYRVLATRLADGLT